MNVMRATVRSTGLWRDLWSSGDKCAKCICRNSPVLTTNCHWVGSTQTGTSSPAWSPSTNKNASTPSSSSTSKTDSLISPSLPSPPSSNDHPSSYHHHSPHDNHETLIICNPDLLYYFIYSILFFVFYLLLRNPNHLNLQKSINQSCFITLTIFLWLKVTIFLYRIHS